MEGQNKGTVSILSTNYLVNTIREGRKNGERFCFILGAGASVSSNIPSGAHLEYIWMEEMNESPGLAEVGSVAKSLKEKGLIDHEFKEIVQIWEKAKKAGRTSLSSEYYFDIYTLRFYPNFRNGYRYLEGEMEHAQPGFGYYSLALMLEEEGGSNLVITTNFDSLVEDALLLYTEKRPLVINHELLAEFAGELNNRRPVIAKLHRGLFFDPLNRPEETEKLEGAWDDVLKKIFDNYTPVVIGYGGGDSSLMGILEEESVVMKNGLYWCYMDEYGLPDKKIQDIVKKKKGHFVRIGGFDAVMLAVGKAIFPEKIGRDETKKFASDRFGSRIRHLEEAYSKAVREANQMQAKEYERQGNESFEEKAYEEAVDCFTKAIEIQQEKEKLYVDRGYAYLCWDKYEEAIDDCNQAITLKQDCVEAYNIRGNAYGSKGENEKAISDYNKAIELKPDYASAYCNRGIVYGMQGEVKQAISDYDKAIELKPDFADAYYNRGIVYGMQGEAKQAISDYDKAIELKPDFAEAYNNRGVAYLHLKQLDEATADLNQALVYRPNYAKPYKTLGLVWKAKGDFPKAEECFTKAIEYDPKDKVAYKKRAEVYRALGEDSKAAADEEAASKL